MQYVTISVHLNSGLIREMTLVGVPEWPYTSWPTVYVNMYRITKCNRLLVLLWENQFYKLPGKFQND